MLSLKYYILILFLYLKRKLIFYYLKFLFDYFRRNKISAASKSSILLNKDDNDTAKKAEVVELLPEQTERDNNTVSLKNDTSFPSNLKINVNIDYNSIIFDKNWIQSSVTKGITISSLDAYPLPYIRGDASFSREFTVQEWLSVIRNPTCRKVWDVRFEDAQVLKVLNNNETIAYSTQKGTFPVAARDFVTKTSLIKENTGYYYLVYSVNPDEFADLTNVPKEGYLGRVRGDLKIACWVLIDKGSSIDISYIVGVDVKGNIPSTIIKSVQAQTPQCINKVEEYLKNKGPPCFVFREDLGKGISSLTENLQENTLTIKFLYESDSKEPSNSKRTGLRISIPKQNFKNGANIGLNLEEKNGYKIFGKVEEPQEFLEVGKSCYKVFFLEFYKNTDKKEEMSVRHLADDDGDDEDSDYEEDEGAVIRTEIEDVNDNTKKLGEVVEKINVTVVVQPNKDGWILNGKHLK